MNDLNKCRGDLWAPRHFRAVLAIAGTALCVAVVAAPKVSPKAGTHEFSPVAVQSSSASSPVVISGSVITRRDQAALEDEAKDNERKAANDAAMLKYTGWLAWATLALVLVAAIQAGLFVWQLKLIAGGEERAKLMAETAKTSADAAASQARSLINSERAYVFAIVDKDQWDTKTNKLTATIAFSNYGKTPAIMTKFRAMMYLDHEIDLSGDLPRALSDMSIAAGLIISNDKPLGEPVERSFSSEEMSSVAHGQTSLYVAGEIEYNDVLGTTHKTGFCWEVLPFENENNAYSYKGYRFANSSTLNYFT